MYRTSTHVRHAVKVINAWMSRLYFKYWSSIRVFAIIKHIHIQVIGNLTTAQNVILILILANITYVIDIYVVNYSIVSLCDYDIRLLSIIHEFIIVCSTLLIFLFIKVFRVFRSMGLIQLVLFFLKFQRRFRFHLNSWK